MLLATVVGRMPEPGFHWYLLIGVSYDSDFFFERKDMILDNLSDILNMINLREAD